MSENLKLVRPIFADCDAETSSLAQTGPVPRSSTSSRKVGTGKGLLRMAAAKALADLAWEG